MESVFDWLQENWKRIKAGYPKKKDVATIYLIKRRGSGCYVKATLDPHRFGSGNGVVIFGRLPQTFIPFHDPEFFAKLEDTLSLPE